MAVYGCLSCQNWFCFWYLEFFKSGRIVASICRFSIRFWAFCLQFVKMFILAFILIWYKGFGPLWGCISEREAGWIFDTCLTFNTVSLSERSTLTPSFKTYSAPLSLRVNVSWLLPDKPCADMPPHDTTGFLLPCLALCGRRAQP